ncbi:MAG: response regulator [Clostridia bacterium]|nr:response regulator [Clostridia bacterium]
MYNLILVDDELTELELLASLLDWAEYGFNSPHIFETPSEAIEYIGTHDVDVIISDIKMPHMNGIEFSKYISENYPDIIFVLLSAYEDFVYAREAIKYHVFDYLNKPIKYSQITELFTRIKQQLDENSVFRSVDYLTMFAMQQSLNDYLFNNSTVEELKAAMKKYDVGINTDGYAALLQISIDGLPEYLATVWDYGSDSLYACLMRFLPDSPAVFLPINSSFNSLNVLAVSSHGSLIQFEHYLNELVRDYPAKCRKNINIKLDITLVRTYESLEYARQSIATMFNVAFQKNTTTKNIPAVSAATEYIHKNFSKDISLADLAELVNLTPYYFSRIFKRATGYNTVDYINHVRLDFARKMLLTTNMKIIDICTQAGYNNKAHFYKLFRHAYGYTPLDFRKHNQINSNEE